MVRVLVAYDTKYGNTALVAEKIAEGMRGTDGFETAVNDMKEVDPKKTAEHNAI